MAKTYAATYLYGKYSEYEKQIFSFIMNGEEIPKYGSDFDDIRYEVKRRQVGNSLVKILDSKDVILITNRTPLSKSFKVFCAKDIKSSKPNKLKVYIDCSNIIAKNEKTGNYYCTGNNIDIFISYLVSAMTTYIYYADDKRFDSSILTKSGATAFAQLFTHVVDTVCKISTMPSVRAKCLYLTTLYYLSNILGRDYTSEPSRHLAKKISGLSDREAGIVDLKVTDGALSNINLFVQLVADVCRLNKLTLDVVVERWMHVYGTGTVFALEIFPAFASMLTDTYVGAYLNNQKAIEKIAGTNMIEFTKTLLEIGADAV